MTERKRKTVCTAIVGGYETLTEQPVALESEFEFVCFTDDPDLESETWRVQHVAPHFPMDFVRSARHVKILLDDYLSGAPDTLWIDNAVTLLSPPEEFFDEWLQDADLAVPTHSFRATLLDEFIAVATHSLDDISRIYEQLVHYSSTDRAALDKSPHWCGIIARRQNERTAALMRLWYDHVLRFSRRDQLSFTYVVRRTNVALSTLPIDSFASVHHRWPTSADRLPEEVRRRFSAAFVPDIARIGVTEERLRDLEEINAREAERSAALAKEHAELLAVLSQTEASLRRNEESAAALERFLEAARTDLEATRAELETAREMLELLLSSRSWRLGTPLRWASDRARRLARRPA